MLIEHPHIVVDPTKTDLLCWTLRNHLGQVLPSVALPTRGRQTAFCVTAVMSSVVSCYLVILKIKCKRSVYSWFLYYDSSRLSLPSDSFKHDISSRRSWRGHVSSPQQWRQVSWPWSREEDQILRSADLHFACFPRTLLQFFAALRWFSCPTWRVSHRESSSCCRPRRERPRRWPKPANVSRRLGLRANRRACEQVEVDEIKYRGAIFQSSKMSKKEGNVIDN